MNNTPKHPDLPNPVHTRRAWPVEEARELLGGISRKTLYDLIQSGDLETVEIGGRRMVPDFAIDKLLERKASEPFAPICAGRNTPTAA